MTAKYWNDVLLLLSMMILVDGKVYDEEVEAFKDAALTLRDIIDPKLMLTRHMAEDWFHQHRDDIEISVSTVFYESSVSRALENLYEMDDKEGLIFALLKVAMSDGQKHPSEEKLLAAARQVWGLDITLAA